MAYSTPIPWRQSSNCGHAKLPLSRVDSPDLWRLLLDCSEDGFVSLAAHRGGVATRHLVWSIDSAMSSHATQSIELHLAVRHIADRGARRADRLLREFFRLASLAAVRAGYGEFVRVRRPEAFYFGDPDHGADRWLSNAILATDLDHTQVDPLVPRWCTLLTPGHLKALGGFDSLHRRATAALAPVHGGPYVQGGRPLPVDLLPLIQLVDCAIVLMSPLESMLAEGSGAYPRPGLPCAVMWLLDEIARAGLHAAQRSDRFSLALERVRHDREKATLRRSRRRPEPVVPASAFIPARLEKDPPRCVRNGCVHDSSPEGFPDRFASPVFRLRPHDLGRDMTIYGRRTSDAETLGSPILVGSLDRDRSALFFDERVHGHDGEFNDPAPDSARPLGRLAQFCCPKCGGRVFQTWVAFEFPDDLTLSGERAARPQDYFSWFWLSARCAACSWAGMVADIECA